MCSTYSQASVASASDLSEPECEQSPSASEMSSAEPCSESTGRESPASMTSTPLTQTDWIGSDPSISSAEASPASPSAMQGNSGRRLTTGISGRRCAKLLHARDPLGSLARMLLGSSRWHSTMCFLTWRVSATPRGRLLFRLLPSMRDTDEIESGSLLASPTATANQLCPSMQKWRSCAALVPTPTATNTKAVHRRTNGRPPRNYLVPTPTARDWKDGTIQACQNVPPNGLLGRVVHLLPTPRAADGPKGSRSPEGAAMEMARTSGPDLPSVAGGSLNPTWVEWLMGFPAGWTALEPSEMPSSRKSSKKSAARSCEPKD